MTLHPPSLKVWAPFVRDGAAEIEGRHPRRDDTSTYPGHGELYSLRLGREVEGTNRGQYAVDYMVSTKAEGDAIAADVWANRDRLGVRYIIWDGKIISETNLPSKWRPYVSPDPRKRGTPSGDHTNHVHQSCYSDGTYVPPATPSRGPKFVKTIKISGLTQPLNAGENVVKLDAEGSLSAVSGPTDGVDLLAGIVVLGPDGKRAAVESWWRVVSYKKGTPTTTASNRVSTTSDQVSYKGALGKLAGGRDPRLRLVVKTPAAGYRLVGLEITGWTL